MTRPSPAPLVFGDTSLRIAYLITRMDSIGGAQIHVRDMALAMRAEGHEVFVLSGSEGPFSSQMTAHGIGLRRLSGLGRSLHPWRDARSFYEILVALRDIRPDLLSLHSSKAGWLGRIAGPLLRIPTIFTAHGWSFSGGLPWHRTLLYRGLEKLAGGLCDRVVTVCGQDRRLADRYRLVPAERLAVIHNGVHDLTQDLLAQPASQPVRIAMVARFQEPKKHSALLEALVPLRELPWTLEFLGDGPLQEDVAGLAQCLGFGDRINFSGACSDVPQRLARAQLFVLLSTREGFPRSILEAMRAGLPVIASDVGGVREAVEEGKTGFLASEWDSAALVSRLRLLLTDPGMRAKMGQTGRERFVQKFTFAVMFSRTLRMYEEVLGRSSKKFKDGTSQ